MNELKHNLRKIAKLAYIAIDDISCHQLAKDLDDILKFAQQLQEVNTDGITAMHHPSEITQRLRDDRVLHSNYIEELATIAPRFKEGFYLVPKAIDKGN
ncbi:MAG: Asp-tRNA(Asn)/Glu-tRNA(Gln) amidotransferase subunit GatC [Legionella sp.]